MWTFGQNIWQIWKITFGQNIWQICKRPNLDVFSPCYEDEGEPEGDEDEEEGSNNFGTA